MARPPHGGSARRSALVLFAMSLAGCGEGGAAGPGAPGLPDGVDRGPGSFENFDRGTRCVLGRLLAPRNLGEVQLAVRWAAHHGVPLKPVSSPASHSENDIICPAEGGAQLSLLALSKVVAVDEVAGEVTVEPAALLGDVADRLHERGLALRNHVPWRDLTAAGAIATGAHHTSLRFPSGIHDLVKRLQVVDGRGEVVVLEGDEAAGASVHLGLLGVVTQVTFQVEPQFKTRASVITDTDLGFEDRVLELARAHDYVSFSWYPAQGSIVMRRHDIVPVSTPGEAVNVGWHSTAAEQALQASLADRLNRAPDGEAEMCGIEALRARGARLDHEEGGVRVTDEAVGYSHRMFSSRCEGLECAWNHGVRIFNPEVAVPVERLPALLRRVRELLAARPACFPVNGIVLRFSKAGRSWLGMNAGADVSYVEFHIARHPDPGDHEQFADAYDELHQLTLLEFDGRPHWGKNFPASFVGLAAALPDGHLRFVELRARLDPNGLFDNAFSARVFGESGPRLEPGCAVDRRCFCRDDVHCGTGRVCRPGRVVPEARICVRP